MSEPTPAPPGRDIPADQRALLQRIQELARHSGELMQQMYESGGDARTSIQAITDITAVDRDRDLTEIRARAAGVPIEWIDRVRTLGQRGFPWRDDQPLPDPAPRDQRRRIRLVATDVERLKDMAAVHSAYLHTRPADEPVSGMEQAVTEQLRRNMGALWMRAGRTAASIGMSAKERAVLWDVTAQEWAQRVERHLAADLADLHTRWRRHGDVTIATEARKSLGKLRRAGLHGPDIPLPDMPMHPQEMLYAAHAATGHDSPGNTENAAITAAVEAALPDDLTADSSAEDHATPGSPGYRAEPTANPDLEP